MGGVWQTCYKCKCQMWVPQALEDAAHRGKGTIEFFCAYGHGQVYSVGESEEQKLRRERDRLAQRIAERDDEIRLERERREGVQRQLISTRGIVTRIKNRVGHGICPCCNRTFANMQCHMHAKHPDYPKAELEAAE